MAKRVLAEERSLQLPAVVVLRRRDAGTWFLGDEFWREEIGHARRIAFSRVDLEAARQFRVSQADEAGVSERSCLLRADALAVDGADPSIEYWLEIRVHHAVDSDKRRALNDANVRALEIDMRWLLAEEIITKERVRAALLGGSAHNWIAYLGHLLPEPQWQPGHPQRAAAARRGRTSCES
jgi:hypothetical protein